MRCPPERLPTHVTTIFYHPTTLEFQTGTQTRHPLGKPTRRRPRPRVVSQQSEDERGIRCRGKRNRDPQCDPPSPRKRHSPSPPSLTVAPAVGLKPTALYVHDSRPTGLQTLVGAETHGRQVETNTVGQEEDADANADADDTWSQLSSEIWPALSETSDEDRALFTELAPSGLLAADPPTTLSQLFAESSAAVVPAQVQPSPLVHTTDATDVPDVTNVTVASDASVSSSTVESKPDGCSQPPSKDGVFSASLDVVLHGDHGCRDHRASVWLNPPRHARRRVTDVSEDVSVHTHVACLGYDTAVHDAVRLCDDGGEPDTVLRQLRERPRKVRKLMSVLLQQRDERERSRAGGQYSLVLDRPIGVDKSSVSYLQFQATRAVLHPCWPWYSDKHFSLAVAFFPDLAVHRSQSHVMLRVGGVPYRSLWHYYETQKYIRDPTHRHLFFHADVAQSAHELFALAERLAAEAPLTGKRLSWWKARKRLVMWFGWLNVLSAVPCVQNWLLSCSASSALLSWPRHMKSPFWSSQWLPLMCNLKAHVMKKY